MKVNLGSGGNPLPDWTNIDRSQGGEAYPLRYPNGSCEAIRASHLLEHFGWDEVPKVLADWHRALKPGGTLYVSVPDFDKIVRMKNDPNRLLYLMGGQKDGNDYHKSAWTLSSLRAILHECGFDDIAMWDGDPRDTSSHPVSLNLKAVKGNRKPTAREFTGSIRAIMSIPRFGCNDHWSAMHLALQPFGIGLETMQGVFWGQKMQMMMERALEDGIDWLLTIDYDSMFTQKEVRRLIEVVTFNPDIDAVACLQPRRLKDVPLLCLNSGAGLVTFDPAKLVKVDTAHFGLTLIRVSALKDLPKPWFKPTPDENGSWSETKIDDDIHFWKLWEKAGKTLYVDPQCRVGHLQMFVTEFDDAYDIVNTHVPEWWDRNYEHKRKCNAKSDNHQALASCPERAEDAGDVVERSGGAGSTGNSGVDGAAGDAAGTGHNAGNDNGQLAGTGHSASRASA